MSPRRTVGDRTRALVQDAARAGIPAFRPSPIALGLLDLETSDHRCSHLLALYLSFARLK